LSGLDVSLDERFRLIFSATAVSDALATISRQSEAAVFDDRGCACGVARTRIARRAGGIRTRVSRHLMTWRLVSLADAARFQYCFTNTETGMTMFDPYRFMLRQAYANGTDVRLYVTPSTRPCEN